MKRVVRTVTYKDQEFTRNNYRISLSLPKSPAETLSVEVKTPFSGVQLQTIQITEHWVVFVFGGPVGDDKRTMLTGGICVVYAQ